jgi:hypothetical protein
MSPAESPAPFAPSASEYIFDFRPQRPQVPEFQAWLRYKNAHGRDM